MDRWLQAHALVLRQNRGGQAEILTMISAFRNRLGSSTAMTFGQARIADPDGFATLVREVEWKLIEMPLPRPRMLYRRSRHIVPS